MRAINAEHLLFAALVSVAVGCGGGDSNQGASDGGLPSDAIADGASTDATLGRCAGSISGAESLSLGCTLALFEQDGNEFLMVQPSSSSSAIDESAILLYPTASPFSTRTYVSSDFSASTKILVQGSTSPSHYVATSTIGSIQLVLTSVDPEPTNGSEPAANTHGTLDASLVDVGDAGPGVSLHLTF